MTRCERCQKRATCTELCEAASRYASCDYVPLRERYSPSTAFIPSHTSTGWDRVQAAAFTPMHDFDFLTRTENDLLQSVFYEGLSYAEAARRFNRKVGGIKSMLARIRGKIASDYSIDMEVTFSTCST